MAADTSELSKVDSAIDGVPGSPVEDKKPGHRRTSSSVAGVFNILDLGIPSFDIYSILTRDHSIPV